MRERCTTVAYVHSCHPSCCVAPYSTPAAARISAVAPVCKRMLAYRIRFVKIAQNSPLGGAGPSRLQFAVRIVAVVDPRCPCGQTEKQQPDHKKEPHLKPDNHSRSAKLLALSDLLCSRPFLCSVRAFRCAEIPPPTTALSAEAVEVVGWIPVGEQTS